MRDAAMLRDSFYGYDAVCTCLCGSQNRWVIFPRGVFCANCKREYGFEIIAAKTFDVQKFNMQREENQLGESEGK